MDLRALITAELEDARQVLDNFLNDGKNIEKIEAAARLMAESVKNGGKLFSCGNGGSMCDAMHFAEELTGRFRDDRKSLPALAISDSSHLTCVSNDYGYEHAFARYLEGLGKPIDVLLAISTSGNSPNIIAAVRKAKEIGMDVVVLTGKGGGKLSGTDAVIIDVNHGGYADRIQEIHIKVIHILIQMIEKLT